MSAPDAHFVFSVKPAQAIELLTRQLVEQQFTLAQMRQTVAALPPEHAAELQGNVDELADRWVRVYLPHLTAALRLAHEVLDTYGPEGVSTTDGFDGGVWDNKFFVWLKELQF
ncbi:hypothetical protein [Mycobacteroides abscessus]|uniref:hypothetical protein n=1 Tax=Mycobacteroides abscessus TaxID=36809 RepID=UPI000C25E25C|nr:hypothetical protein [Mycobacteroides abscessus]